MMKSSRPIFVVLLIFVSMVIIYGAAASHNK